ncbi:hypothetical protein HY637_03820 [Candidatus Woesearchaeota archaeon]|nr:hypothetical protein [Candidatus Woesearchaeota archaeon]
MVHIAAVGITTVIFGIASLILISRARKKLSEGSIRRFMDNFAICLAFIVTFSIWQTVRNIYESGLELNHATYLTYPEYIFIIFAYIAFIITSFRTQKISEEFGFKEQGRRIGKLVTEKAQKPSENAEAALAKKQKKSRQNRK